MVSFASLIMKSIVLFPPRFKFPVKRLLDVYLQSVTKIIRKIAILAISCFYPLPPLNNVEKQRAKLASTYVMGLQHCIGGQRDF